MSKPFTTISGAAAASVTGDLIYVRAGTYAINSQINLNNEGHLYFEPGSTVSVATGVTAFSFNQITNFFPAANSIRIQGHADFVLSGSAGILTIPASLNTASPPIVAFECNSITGPDAANGTLFNIVNGVLSVDAKTIAMTTTFTASNATVFNITGTGDVTTRIPFVYCGRFVNGSGAAFPGGGAVAAKVGKTVGKKIVESNIKSQFVKGALKRTVAPVVEGAVSAGIRVRNARADGSQRHRRRPLPRLS
jgi:hypothetical protein